MVYEDILDQACESKDESEVIPMRQQLKYSCIYWASHFFEAQLSGDDLIEALHTFLHKDLLHWIECLDELGELQTGIPSLRSMATALSVIVSDFPMMRWELVLNV